MLFLLQLVQLKHSMIDPELDILRIPTNPNLIELVDQIQQLNHELSFYRIFEYFLQLPGFDEHSFGRTIYPITNGFVVFEEPIEQYPDILVFSIILQQFDKIVYMFHITMHRLNIIGILQQNVITVFILQGYYYHRQYTTYHVQNDSLVEELLSCQYCNDHHTSSPQIQRYLDQHYFVDQEIHVHHFLVYRIEE